MRIIERIPEGAVEYKKPKIDDVRDFLTARVVGQKEATDRVAQELVHVLSGISADKRGPRGSILMLGPSGVGKTETALAAVDYLLSRSAVSAEQRDPEKFLLKIDCGAFALDHQVSSLIGAPPGYLGSKSNQNAKAEEFIPPALDNAALASHAIKLEDGQEVSVVLLDEIEKAHQTVKNFLLAALDRGITKNAANEEINFRDTLFIFTSNLGNKGLALSRAEGGSLGFGKNTESRKIDGGDKASAAKIRRKALLSEFRPEDISRMSGGAEEAVIFNELDRAACEKILGIQLEAAEREFLESGLNVTFQLTRAAADRLLDLGVNPDTGARALKTVLKHRVLQPLLHPSKVATFQSLGGKQIFIDYPAGASEFSFFTQAFSEDKKIGEKKPISESGSAKVEGISPREELGLVLDFQPSAAARLRELNVVFNADTLTVEFLNLNVMNNPINFYKYAKGEGFKRLEIYPQKGMVLFDFSGASSRRGVIFLVNEDGLPSSVQFNAQEIKSSKRPVYKWLGEVYKEK